MEPTTTETTTMQVIDEQPQQPLYGKELAEARRAEREAKRLARLESKELGNGE